jgi:hypothetical protein
MATNSTIYDEKKKVYVHHGDRYVSKLLNVLIIEIYLDKKTFTKTLQKSRTG